MPAFWDCNLPNSKKGTTQSCQAGFICLEKKGVESYPSKDKAVLFFEVADLQTSIAAIGRDRWVRIEKSCAVLDDPEGHNVLLLERAK